MKEMLQRIRDRQESGEDLVLVTVIGSNGGTPRGAGAHMLIGEQGGCLGTIGGGAVEFRAQEMAQEILKEKQSAEKQFSLVKDDEDHLEMVCGGAVRLYFSYLPAENRETAALAAQAEKHFRTGADMWLILDLADGGRIGLYTEEDGFLGVRPPEWLREELGAAARRIQRQGQDFFVEQISSAEHVYIFGGGHVAQELVPVLTHVGFRCVVMDDREDFADPASFPEAEAVLQIDFRRIADRVTIKENDYVCVMTRGHASDMIILTQVLRTPASYIGMIGSRHKKTSVFNALYEQGFTEADTDRITTPIGLDILAETPAEIAISIAGQMIRHRAEQRRK